MLFLIFKLSPSPNGKDALVQLTIKQNCLPSRRKADTSAETVVLVP